MLKLAFGDPARRPRRAPSPLKVAIAAYRRAEGVAGATADDNARRAVLEAEEAIVRAPCASDAEFMQKLSYLLCVLREQCGREPEYGDDFEPIAHAVAIYLEQRKPG